VVLYSMLTGEFPFKTVSDIITGTFTDPDYISKGTLVSLSLSLSLSCALSLCVLTNDSFTSRLHPIDSWNVDRRSNNANDTRSHQATPVVLA